MHTCKHFAIHPASTSLFKLTHKIRQLVLTDYSLWIRSKKHSSYGNSVCFNSCGLVDVPWLNCQSFWLAHGPKNPAGRQARGFFPGACRALRKFGWRTYRGSERAWLKDLTGTLRLAPCPMLNMPLFKCMGRACPWYYAPLDSFNTAMNSSITLKSRKLTPPTHAMVKSNINKTKRWKIITLCYKFWQPENNKNYRMCLCLYLASIIETFPFK